MRTPGFVRGISIALAVATVGLASPASSNPAASDDELEALRGEIESRDRLIDQLLERLERLEGRVERIDASGRSSEPAPRGNATALRPPRDVLPEGGARAETNLVEQAFEQTLIDRGGLLLPWRTFSLEPSASYVHSSSDNVVVDGFTVFPVLVVGDITSEKMDSDIVMLSMTARMGLPWDSQLEVRVPYGAQRVRSHSADGAEFDLTDTAFGDVEVSLSHQLYRSEGTWPDLLASAGWKFDTGRSPFDADEGDVFTGTGYHAANFRLTGVKVIDPVVYFFGANYTYNLSTKESVGTFDPGYSVGFDLGMAIALNLNTSLSLSYDQRFTAKSELDGVDIPGSYSTIGVFSVGSTYSFSEAVTLDFSLGIGVTADSPDLFFGISMPWRGHF